jgi:ABC-2 type transport system permease protein
VRTLGPATLIARKDLLRRLRDRTAILTAIVLPFGLAWIFSLTLSGVDEDSFEATYAVVDDDGGDLAEAFAQTLGSIDGVTVVDAPALRAAEDRIAGGDLDAAFEIPSGFSDDVRGGGGARMVVRTSTDAPIAGIVAGSVARSFAARLDAIAVTVTAATAADPSVDAAAVADRAQALPPAAQVVEATAEDRLFSSTTFFAIGMAVFFLFFAVEFGVRGLLEEREEGTLARLLVAPIAPGSVIGGKALASFAVGLVSTTLLVLATTWLLDARWGDPIGVTLLVLGGVLAAVGVTALVATLATTTAQAGAYVSIVAVVGGLLGGTFFPISQAGFLGTIRFLSPQGWLMEGFQELSYGGTVGEIAGPLLGVFVIAGVTGSIAWARSRRMVVA